MTRYRFFSESKIVKNNLKNHRNNLFDEFVLQKCFKDHTYKIQFSSVAQSRLTLCDPMDCSTQGLPVHHQLPEFTQTHVHCIGDAMDPTISSSVIPFSSHLQSFPASGSFQMSRFFTLGGQSIWVSTSASVLPMNIQDWFPLGWTGWISFQSKGLSRVNLNMYAPPYNITEHVLHLVEFILVSTGYTIE